MGSKEKAYKSVSRASMQLINTMASLMKVLLLAKKAPRMPIAQSDTCIVLGTGPSLKTSLEKFPEHFFGQPLLCVNTFCLTEEFTKLKPSYYVMMDPSLWYSDNDLVQKVMATIREKTTWKLYFMVPQDARRSKRIAALAENPNIELIFFNYVVFKGFDRIARFFFRKNMAMPQSENVLVASIFLMINVGYKRIELFGADHSWHEQLHVTEENVVGLKHVHFYEDEKQLKVIPFYKGMHSKEIFRMDEAFISWAKVFYGHLQIKKYASSRGTEVYNASEKTFVDAYPRFHVKEN